MLALPILSILLCTAAPTTSGFTPGQTQIVRSEPVVQWDFDKDTDEFSAEHHCQLSAAQGHLMVDATDLDPYFQRRVDLEGGQLRLQLRARGSTPGNGAIYWTTDRSPSRGEDKANSFSLVSDGQWHEYSVSLLAPGRLTNLRLDPGDGPGRLEIDWIRIVRDQLHPITIDFVECDQRTVRFRLVNHQSAPIEVSVSGRKATIPGRGDLVIDRPSSRSQPLEAVSIEVESGELPRLRRTVFVHHPEAQTAWIERPLASGRLQVARDGSVARLDRAGQLVAVLAPLVHRDGRIPKLQLTEEGSALRLEGEGTKLTIATDQDEITIRLESDKPCEGPVVRAVGGLEQGLFAGLEYLEGGEHSSSTLDVETPEHVRYVPEPIKVTLPLMAFVTDRGAVAMTWSDNSLQPVYATPNIFDGTADHRMALRGQKIEATIRLEHAALEELIAWYVKKHGLPALPKAPRSVVDQWELCLKGLNGPLHTKDGWGHCGEPHWPRAPYADHASTLWRLTGKAPEVARLAPGGAHVHNDSIYFVTGRAAQWLEVHRQWVRGALGRQQPDGSFRYDGKYRRGHFEDTASGICAQPAMVLLEHAYQTGDRQALEAGLRALDYMKRFRTPRGAQTWEVPLHTPDQLASAHLVWAYVRGYELTGRPDYLREARRWALSGVPFVYLWSSKPIMLYGTPPVLGATDWRAPCWIGLPVQWVGGVYAYALTRLAPYDKSLDWNHLARGILLSAEQQQYPDGKWAGLLPDSFALETQQRRPWNINPCALVSLRLVLDGQLDSLAVAAGNKHRILAPFPVTLHNGKAHVQAREGVQYQVLIDGSRIVDVQSHGEDVISLD